MRTLKLSPIYANIVYISSRVAGVVQRQLPQPIGVVLFSFLFITPMPQPPSAPSLRQLLAGLCIWTVVRIVDRAVGTMALQSAAGRLAVSDC
jgi:hypothetical protein